MLLKEPETWREMMQPAFTLATQRMTLFAMTTKTIEVYTRQLENHTP
jgi:hypothetical protein